MDGEGLVKVLKALPIEQRSFEHPERQGESRWMLPGFAATWEDPCGSQWGSSVGPGLIFIRFMHVSISDMG